MDGEAVRGLGCNGFEELVARNPALEQHRPLFGPVASSTPRELLQPTEAAACVPRPIVTPAPSRPAAEPRRRLDAQLAALLRRLSPVFQQPAALKCIEHLLRRHKVHIHNVEAVNSPPAARCVVAPAPTQPQVLKCILPYHDTKLFARTVQLLDIEVHSPCAHPPTALPMKANMDLFSYPL